MVIVFFMMELYITLIALGLILFLINEFAEMEVPYFVGFFFALPYCLFLWGLFGILRISEPMAFVAGFLIPLVLILILYFALSQNKEFRDLIIGQKGRITVKTDLESTGEVVVETEWGRQFLLAKPSDNQLKPLLKGDEVVVVDFEPPYAFVEKPSGGNNTVSAKRKRFKLPTLKSLLKGGFFKNRLSDQVCGICYGQIARSSLTFCPHCQTPFHQDHIQSWISAKGQCPVCRNSLVELTTS